MDDLEELLQNPPRSVHKSPLAALTPLLFRILASPDAGALITEALDLCQPEDLLSVPIHDLRDSLWGEPRLDRARLRLLLARWSCERSEPLAAIARSTLEMALRSRVTQIILNWVDQQDPAGSGANSQMRQRLRRDLADDPEICPACGEALVLGDDIVAKCRKGHEWARCSLTQILITNPSYRLCSTCSAVALLPSRHLRPPRTVADNRVETESSRFAQLIDPGRGDWMAQTVLEAAVCCPICGGRWMRAV